jgi:hypothetical protein
MKKQNRKVRSALELGPEERKLARLLHKSMAWQMQVIFEGCRSVLFPPNCPVPFRTVPSRSVPCRPVPFLVSGETCYLHDLTPTSASPSSLH